MVIRGDAGCFTAGVMGVDKRPYNQRELIGTAFCVLIFIRDITLLKIKGMYWFPSNE